MRRGLRLIALAALGALAVPTASSAVQAEIAGDLVKQIVVTAKVKHLATGKVGTFSLNLQQRQGVSLVKPPIGTQLDDYDLDPHVGEGVPSGGLPKLVGCMNLSIPGVITHRNRCVIFGDSGTFDTDPLLSELALGVTMGPDNQYKTTITLNARATDEPPTQESVERVTELRPTTKNGGGYLIDAAEGFKRTGIIVGGILYDETPNVNTITLVPDTERVTLRQYVDVHNAFDRRSLVCSSDDPADRGIFIGALGTGVDVLSPDNDDPDNLPQPGPDQQNDYLKLPPGCYPDDQTPDTLP